MATFTTELGLQEFYELWKAKKTATEVVMFRGFVDDPYSYLLALKKKNKMPLVSTTADWDSWLINFPYQNDAIHPT